MPAPTASVEAAPLPAPPTVAALERRSRRYQWLDIVALAGLLLANGYLAFAIASEVSPYALLVAAVLFGLSCCIHLGWTLSLFFSPKSRLVALSASDTVGRYGASEIYLMMQELLEPHRGREMPEVYITDARHDGAYVVNSLLFNRIKPLNAVYISRHLFTILRPAEIKAILAHELAHFYRYIRPLSRARFALMAFNALVPLQLTLNHGAISLWAAVGVWAALSGFYIGLLNAWLIRVSQDHEYLCDLAAARRFGILPLVNGLIGVLRTAELQSRIANALTQRIRADNSLSINALAQLLEKCEAKLPQGIVGIDEIEAALDSVLADPETEKLRRTLSEKQVAAEEKSIQELAERLLYNRAFRLIDWKRFDYVIPDGRLDGAEYARLVRILETCEDPQLFEIATDNLAFTAKGSHPTIAQRILFLETARRNDPSIPL